MHQAKCSVGVSNKHNQDCNSSVPIKNKNRSEKKGVTKQEGRLEGGEGKDDEPEW